MSYLKPEVAVLKFCPYRTTNSVSTYNCLAESCMAWRQQTVYTSPNRNNTTKQPTGKGYCGLAGKPD